MKIDTPEQDITEEALSERRSMRERAWMLMDDWQALKEMGRDAERYC
jgi:hypothetical protein